MVTTTQLNAEITARKAGDATNASANTAEGTARKAADAALLTRIAALEASMANVVLTITKLTTGTVTPPVPPQPEPPVIPGVAKYISPSGSDTTGDGSLTKPWKTYTKFYATAVAGDTLYCRGGDYTSVPAVRVTTISGTASQPITVRAYPGETPIFHGTGSDVGGYAIALDWGSSYHVIDGLQFINFQTYDNAIIGMGQGTAGDAVYNKIRNCKFTLYPGSQTDHCVYISWRNNHTTVENCVFIGAGDGHGSGVLMNASGGTPGAVNALVQRCVFVGFGSRAAVKVNDEQNTAQFLHNTFISNMSDIDIRWSAAILIRDCATTNPAGNSWLYDLFPGNTTKDHNFQSQLFDSTYHLNAGQTGIGAASDGTNAGAL